MRNWPEKRRQHARIEIIPMIDVMMFLLVFFVLISINVLPALGLKIKPPSSASPDQVVERQKTMVGIDRDGKIFLDGQQIEIADLPDRLRALEDPNKKLVVIIAGDEGAQLQNIVSVLDALKLAGVASAQIVARPR
ncbi:ExbD/TolR family protein [Rhodomicrobium lacus]|nr:biopolymer transporter ExbD [Rhodomicrobium lacus]